MTRDELKARYPNASASFIAANVAAVSLGAARLRARETGCDDESELHADIQAECRRRGWLALHGSMAHKAKRTAGEPDFTIIREMSQEGCCYGVPCFLLIECKTRTGKLSPAQQALHAHASKLGHKVHVVRSFTEFLAIL